MILPRSFAQDYTYLSTRLAPQGQIVQVDLRGKLLWGIVSGTTTNTHQSDQIKQVVSYGPQLNPALVKFIKDIARSTFVQPGKILELVLQKEIPQLALQETPETPKLDTKPHAQFTLDQDQQNAAKQLINTTNQVYLLQGSTGSGKTEVYFKIIEHALIKNAQVILLLPEISLTKEWQTRFRSHFGFDAHVWHSKLSKKHKEAIWTWAIKGYPGVVVGARSAIFLPCKHCELIIIDEEHDYSYKQERSPRYHAREVALKRIQHCKGKLILVSATPSLEALQIAEEIVKLKRQPQLGLAPLTVHQATKNPISPELLEKILLNAQNNQQASLLLVNRRGYASYASCVQCGHRIMCNTCSVALSWHNTGLRCHWCGFPKRWPTLCACGSNKWNPCGWGLERIYDWLKLQQPELRIACVSSDTPKVADILGQLGKGELDLVIGTQIISQGHNLANVSLVAMLDIPHSLDFRAQERLYQLICQTRGRAGRGQVPGTAWWETDNTNNDIVRYIDNPQLFYQAEIEKRRRAKMPPFANLMAIIVSAPTTECAKRISIRIGNWKPEDALPKNQPKLISESQSILSNTHPKEELISQLNNNIDTNLLSEQNPHTHQSSHNIRALENTSITPDSLKLIEKWGPSPAPIAKIKNIYRWRILARGNEIVLRKLGEYACSCATKTVLVEIDWNPYSFY